MEGVDLAALFDASPNPYVILDRDLIIVGMNAAYLAVTMRKREDIIGRKMFDAFPSDPKSQSHRLLRGSLQRVLETDAPDHLAVIPYPIALPDGTMEDRFWSATHTPIRDVEGRLTHILQHTVDITELQRLRMAVSRAGIIESNLLSRAEAVQAQNEMLSAEGLHLRSLFEQAPSFMAVLTGPDHRFELANSAYMQITGHRDILGKSVAEALPEVVEQGFIGLLDKVRTSGEPFIGRALPIMLQVRPGLPPEQRFLDFIYQPIFGSDGTVTGIFVQGYDLSEQKRAEAELLRQKEVLRVAQEAGGIGTFEWDLETGIVIGSQTFAALYGVPEMVHGVPVSLFSSIVHPEDRQRLAVRDDQPFTDNIQRTEYRVMTPHGVRWILRKGEVVRDETGKPIRVLGAAYDVTDRKEWEAQMALLTGESAHRVKNMLSMVNAITAQTLRSATSMEEAREAIGTRLAALAQAQGALTEGHGASAEISEVVRGATELHAGDSTRFSVSGPRVQLNPKAVLALGLMLHELSTNALKYGALSVETGRVEIRWWRDAQDPVLVRFRWAELDGPLVIPPARKGFGTKLIERGLAANLGGRVTLTYAADGLVCEAEMRVEAPR